MTTPVEANALPAAPHQVVPMTVFTGVTGAGKSRALIMRAQAARDAGRLVNTFVCSTYPWPRENSAYWQRRQLVCRVPGLTTELDHFVSSEQMRQVMTQLPPGSVIAVEEAFAFGTELVPILTEAASRGIEALVAHPSPDQLKILQHPFEENRYSMKCDQCNVREGEEPIIPWDGAWTKTVCKQCFEEAREDGRRTIVQALHDNNPEPGSEALYQPIPLPEVETWPLARNDTLARAEVVAGVLARAGLLENGQSVGRLSYLDIGCCTGSFCHYFASRGMSAKGVDALEGYVGVARLLDSYFRRQVRREREFVLYEHASAYDYLKSTSPEQVDVSTAFAVFQWVMVQRSYDAGAECIEMLAEKTRRVMVLEMPYSVEEHYSDKLSVPIDRDWVLGVVRPCFAQVDLIEAGTHGIKRDLFIGYKDLPQRSARK